MLGASSDSRGWVVNQKKIRRLMRKHAMQSPRRRRFVATTDSDHDEPVFLGTALGVMIVSRRVV